MALANGGGDGSEDGAEGKVTYKLSLLSDSLNCTQLTVNYQ